jgi:PTH1 family peptidyl-tRNA hydrolase
MPWLVAGLGNPGERYANTRHNLGAMVAAELVRAEAGRFRRARFLPAEVAEIRIGPERVLVVRSSRFMNESGPSFASLANRHHVEPGQVVAVYDDLDLAPGGLRLRLGGGAGGHNGVRSLIQALGTPDFLRVKIGIGRPPGRQDPADFVLEPIPKRLADEVAGWADDAAEAVRSLIGDGLEAAQDRHNRRGTTT